MPVTPPHSGQGGAIGSSTSFMLEYRQVPKADKAIAKNKLALIVIKIPNNLTQMTGSQISIEIPKSVLEVTNADAATFAVQLRILAAVKLYEMESLSSSKAAQLAGMSRVEFLLNLGNYKVFPFAKELQELEVERASSHQ
ncbi:MAG: UPF0175 family protein [Hormoscilla sp.]